MASHVYWAQHLTAALLQMTLQQIYNS